MIVFKTFFKVLKQYKLMLIIYTVMLVFFGAFITKTNENTTNFAAEKPDVLIINKDENIGITKQLCEYVKDNANIKEIDNNKEAIDDAIFYRDVNYIMYIPENFNSDFLGGREVDIDVKSSGDYQGSYMEMLLSRYLKIAKTYQSQGYTEAEIIDKIDKTLEKEVGIQITSKLNVSALSKANMFYNFASYSILAGCVFVIGAVMSSFRERNIKRRTGISSTKYTSYNRQLLLGNSVFSFVLWILYVIISFVLIKDAMFTMHGVYYIINSFIFTLCCLAIAFCIGSLITSKEAIGGIVNVVALGSSFLCGAFVPAQWLPDAVIKVAHGLPTYWYIQNNELIAKLEKLNLQTLTPYIKNSIVVLLFTLGFVLFTNFMSRRTRQEN